MTFTTRGAGVLLLACCAVLPVTMAEAASSIAPYDRSRNVPVLREVWDLVSSNFYDPDLNGLDWESALKRYALAVSKIKTRSEFAEVVNRMIGELQTSHTRYFTPEEPEYYQILDIFSGSTIGEELTRDFPGGRVVYPGIGAFTREIDGKVFVTGVVDGSQAERAELRVGDEIVSANGAPFEAVNSFVGKVGHEVVLDVRRTADPEQRLEIAVVPELIQPREMFEKAIAESAAVHRRVGKSVAYVRVWSYAGREYQELLLDQLAQEPIRDADALVLDIRDGWGGADPRYLNMFNEEVPTLTSFLRDGTELHYDPQWRRPVVLLVNGGTRSGNEILAFGFKKFGIGPVVGGTTAGAVVAGKPFMLSDDSLLYLAVRDVLVDGIRLEGVGVDPDHLVPFDVRYAAGNDPQIERALDVAAEAAVSGAG